MSPREYALMLFRKALADQHAAAVLAADQAATEEVIGFHAQQAVEKFIKAVLVHSGIEYPPTHNLAQLVSLLGEGTLAIPVGVSSLETLTPYAVALRHDDVDLEDEESLDLAGVLEWVAAVKGWAEGAISPG